LIKKKEKKMKKLWIVKMVLFVILAVLLAGAAVMYLWNMLVPALFNGPSISFIQAVGLLILSKLLFKGFNFRKGGHCSHGHGYWKEKLDKMDPEERDRLKALWKRRCGSYYGEKDPGESGENKDVNKM
jgi:hypothetical protein